MSEGHIYAASNAAMPGLLKIGRTKVAVADRLRALSAHTGVPLPFALQHAEPTKNCDIAEQLVFERLKDCRVSPTKEFFRISVAEAITAIKRVCAEVNRAKEPCALVRYRYPIGNCRPEEIGRLFSDAAPAFFGLPRNTRRAISADGSMLLCMQYGISPVQVVSNPSCSPGSRRTSRFCCFSVGVYGLRNDWRERHARCREQIDERNVLSMERAYILGTQEKNGQHGLDPVLERRLCDICEKIRGLEKQIGSEHRDLERSASDWAALLGEVFVDFDPDGPAMCAPDGPLVGAVPLQKDGMLLGVAERGDELRARLVFPQRISLSKIFTGMALARDLVMPEVGRLLLETGVDILGKQWLTGLAFNYWY